MFKQFFIISTCLLQLIMVSHAGDSREISVLLNPDYVKKSDLVISGTVIKRDEIWDRRQNKEMGRPDILIEIILRIKIDSLLKDGSLPSKTITISIKEKKALIRYKFLSKGKCGIFYLAGKEMPFSLIGFETRGVDFVCTNDYTEEQVEELLFFPEKISGRTIQKSKLLQERAAKKIGDAYGMKDASVITLVSYSGPEPPTGGYVYWGVKGLIDGKWHVWQNGKLREGTELEDPKRYQKCNSPFTMILTPSGNMPIKDLKVGDLVISDGKKAVPILKTSKVKVKNHLICRLTLDDGTILEISPDHLLADGRLLGDMIYSKHVDKTELIQYKHDYTYDILPDSPSGIYFANGVMMDSTLKVTLH